MNRSMMLVGLLGAGFVATGALIVSHTSMRRVGSAALVVPKVTPPVSTSESKAGNSVSSSSSDVENVTNSQTTMSSSSNVSNVSISLDSGGSGTNEVTVDHGAKVHLTVSVTGTGSLDLRSDNPALNFGVVLGGSSRSVEFNADRTYTITPYRDGSPTGGHIMIGS